MYIYLYMYIYIHKYIYNPTHDPFSSYSVTYGTVGLQQGYRERVFRSAWAVPEILLQSGLWCSWCPCNLNPEP